MSEIKLTLNSRHPPAGRGSTAGTGNALKAAAQRKQAQNESLEDAWRRILATNLTDKDRERLLAVKAAMDAGELGRDPADMRTKKGALKRFSKAEALRLYAVLAEQQREGKLADMVANTPENYRLILDRAALAEVIAQCESEPIIAVDTETTGLDVYTDVIVGVSITTPSTDTHYYIPIKPTQDSRAMDAEPVLNALKTIMEDASIGKVFHNANYDIQMFMRHGIELRGLAWDTQPAMHLLNENEPSYALKNLATKYLREPSDTFDELFGRNAQFADIPLDIALVYAAKDTDLTWRLYEFQRKHLAKMPEVLRYFETVEVPLISAVVDMERTGFMIDVDFAKEYGEQMARDIEQLRGELNAELGDINLNSPPQLKEALEAATGERLESTDAKRVLKPMARKYPVIEKLLRYKELTKLYSTYISVLPEKVHPVTGRLHARFNPNGTVTGRFSSGGNGVNLQNQPYEARKLFVAPPGHVIIGADWSQQEVRCAAYFTQEPSLLRAYAEGRDVYATMASEFYGKPYEECGDGTPERKAMKVIVLAVLYGMGPGSLSQSLGISDKEAREFMADFFAKMPYVKRWIDRTQSEAKRQGYVWMDGKQRKRRLPDAKRKVRGYVPEVSRALRQGPNAVIQGTSAIQAKTTIVAAHEFVQRKGWRLWATVHDELLVLAPEDFTREDLAEFERIMVDTYRFGDVSNKTDIEIARRWGVGMTADEWFAKEGGQ